MIKSLVGLQKTNNFLPLISRYHEGTPSAPQFLTESILLSREYKAHSHAVAYSHYSLAHIGSKGGQNLIRV
jgi:hypothetical protein